ncbi:MAG: PD-(D/E)XK nuclease family transposase, partial [Bacteroidota bacterium]
ELTSHFDKWLYVLKYLPSLEERPPALRERVFENLFEIAEIAKFKPEEQEAYVDSLKYYRDLKGVVDTAWEEGREEGREEGSETTKINIAQTIKAAGVSISDIAKFTGLSAAEIEAL